MFFLDSTGFFSLICLLVQCGLAWVFAAFFAVLVRQHGRWLRGWLAAFVGLGVGLLALTVRFLFAYHATTGWRPLVEGDVAVRTAYAIYAAGKVLFVCGLLEGIANLHGRPAPVSARWLPWSLLAGLAIGAAVPTVECLLLFQAAWVPWAFLWAQRWLAVDRGEAREFGRVLLVGVLRAWALVWLVYGVAVVVVGPVHPDNTHPVALVLRLNAMVDLVLQVVLGTSLIMMVLRESQRGKDAVLRERDRLREQVQRDERARALATLVGGIAHEINNPLTVILGHAADLDAGEPTVRARAAAIVRDQCERCRQIVQRMSMLGALPPSAREVDVDEVLASVVRDLQPRCDAAGVTLRCEVPRLMQTWAADPDGVERVLGNLLGNAIEASPRGGEVRLRIGERSDGVVFEVEDQGRGVPLADRTRVFDPFFTTKNESTGLGLAVVAAVVRAHGGRVEIGDAPGGGARFCVVWPWRPMRTIAPAAAHEPSAAGAKPGSKVPAAGTRDPAQKPRLLVIDDEPLVRATVARQAKMDGYEVDEADSAARGLELLLGPGADYAAIVCDLRMPGLSGAQFHDRLVQHAPHWLDRLLFITGDLASIESVEFAARSRAPILTKPFTAGDLMRRVRSLQDAG